MFCKTVRIYFENVDWLYRLSQLFFVPNINFEMDMLFLSYSNCYCSEIIRQMLSNYQSAAYYNTITRIKSIMINLVCDKWKPVNLVPSSRKETIASWCSLSLVCQILEPRILTVFLIDREIIICASSTSFSFMTLRRLKDTLG